MADDNSPSNKSVEGSPSPLDETLLENLADVAGRTPTLDMNVEAGDTEEEKTPAEKETGKKKEHSSSHKKKEHSTPFSTPRGGESSRTESSPARQEVDDKTMKELSLSEGSGGEEEEEKEVDSGEGEGSDRAGDDDVEELGEPPAKKARVQTRVKGKQPLVSVKKEKVKSDLANREIVVPKKLDFKLLGRLGIAEGVKENFENIGWEYFLDWETTTYAELVKEFYEELYVEMGKAGPEFISFRLRGVERTVKISDLNAALGMVDWVDLSTKAYLDSEKVVPNYTDAEWTKMWKKLSGEGAFKASVSRESSIKDHALRMCHRIVSYNLYGKKDSSNTVSKAELYILYAMQRKKKLDFAAFVAAHLKGITSRTEQRLSLTHMVTILAKAYKSISSRPNLTKEKEDHFDLNTLKRMFYIQEGKKGELKMLDEPEKPPRKALGSFSKNRATQSSTPEPSQEGTAAALARIQESLEEIQSALAAYFAHQGFRYPPETS